MAEFEIRPGNRRHRSLDFTKKDGSAGKVQDPPVWALSNETLAKMDVDPDGMSGFIAHNGSVGDVVCTSEADGDLGEGVNRIVITDTFHMMQPLGASGGTSTVDEEEPIP